jgi:hypothetical protein
VAFIERWHRKGQPEQTAPLAKSGSNSKKERRQQVLSVDAEVIVTTHNASKAQALFKKNNTGIHLGGSRQKRILRVKS